MAKKKDTPHREKTDASLRAERIKADDEYARRRDAVEADADDVVRVARERADAVLKKARNRADDRTRAGGGKVSTADETARAHEDAAVRVERLKADETLAGERELQQLALASLLASERADTDQRLAVERANADQLLSSRDDLLGMVSHDLRSFLGTIALSAEMVGRLPCTNESFAAVARHSERIKAVTAEMARLVGDLLDVASIDAGRMAIVLAPHDAGQLVRDAVDVFQPAAVAAGVTLSAEAPDERLEATFDADRLLQVLSNIVGNAFKFTPRTGRVVVRVHREGDAIRFAVADSGEGISPDKLDSIFERFSQGRRVDRRGVGLGLFISRRIIEAHGGKMWVVSTLGEGSTFFFTVPCG